MRSYVRYLAAASAASLLVFAACGGDTAAPASPDLSSGSLNYTITPNQVSWTRLPNGPMPVETKQVLIGGLIAVGGYPQFGAIQYDGANDWLEMVTVPDLSRSPLAWRFTFKLKPKAATLPIGRYTATIPVNVPAAQNNPQSIVVVFNHCDNCLFVGDYRDGALTADDPMWAWDDDYNNNAGGGHLYDDWRVFVPAFTTVSVIVEGDDCLGFPYTHEDNTLTAWTTPDLMPVDDDDDGYCGNDPIVTITNSTGAQREYLVRAGSYDAFGGSRWTGTYRIHVFIGGDDYDYDLRATEPGDKPTPVRAPRR